MKRKIVSEKDIPQQIYRDRDILTKKMEELIVEFNEKWMHEFYISCESPLLSNEYPLAVKLNKMLSKDEKKSFSSVHNLNLSTNRFFMNELI
jgi:hypothetical protein